MSSLLTSAFILSTLLAAEPARETAPTSNLPDAAVLGALCPAKEACTVVDKLAAGQDASGNDLVFAGVQAKGKGKPQDKTEDDNEEPCLPAPYGLLHVKAKHVVSVEPIVTLREGDCSYGARGGGEAIAFDGKLATYTMDGGSNWAWSESKTWEIRPSLRQIEEASEGWWTVSSNYSRTVVDLRRGRTTVTWHVPDCDANGQPPDPNQEGSGTDSAAKYGYLEIPRRDPGATFDWKTAGFPQAGLTITSQKDDGFITFGKAGKARDARFRVIALSSRELLVEVADPEVAGNAKNWVNDDHLEIWAGPELPNYQTHCIERNPAAKATDFTAQVGVAQQWGIRTHDGSVSRGQGKPRSDPKVERVELDSADWGHVYRFHITFDKDLASVTVAYSDSNHGKRQLRLFATSNIQLRDPLSLGELGPAPEQK